MYFTFYKDGEIMASGCAQVIEEYDQLYFFNEYDGCAYLARGGATELAIESLGTYTISGSGSNGADEAFADIADVWFPDGEKDGLSCIVILADGQWAWGSALRPGRTLSPWTAASWSRIRTTRTSITPAPAPLMTSPMICTPPLKRTSSGGAGKMTPTCARRTASRRALPPCVHADKIKAPLLRRQAKERSFYLILRQSHMAYTEFLLQDHQLMAAFLLQNLCHIPA